MGGGGSKAASSSKRLCKEAIRDGKTNTDIEDKVKNTFEEWDKDRSGSISLPELCAVFQTLDPKLKSADLKKVMESVDVNHDGSISYEEFVAWIFCSPDLDSYFKKMKEIHNRSLNEGKKLWGTISDEASLAGLGLKLEALQKKTKTEFERTLTPIIKKVFAWHDKDGSGVLEYDESIIFISNYADKLLEFLESTSEASFYAQSSFNAKSVTNVEGVHTALTTQMAAKRTAYLANIQNLQKAGFDVVDINKDGKLQEAEVVAALLPGGEKNEQFMTALELLLTPDDILAMTLEAIDFNAQLQECLVQ